MEFVGLLYLGRLMLARWWSSSFANEDKTWASHQASSRDMLQSVR